MNPVTYDVCVVGAGMIGSCAARHASQQGHKTCLVGPDEPKVKDIADSRDIYGAYYDEGRIARSTASDKIWATLASRSIARYRSLERQSGVKFYDEVGCLTIGRRGGKYITNSYNSACNDPSANVVRKSPQETLRMFPYICVEGDEESVWQAVNAGCISPRGIVAAEQKIAQMHGCNIVRDIVAQIKPLHHNSGNQIIKLTTDTGKIIHTKKVLIATGAFTEFRDLLPPGYKPDILITKQSVLLAELSEADLEKLRNMPSIVWEETEPNNHGCYILPPIKYPDGKTYVKLGHGSLFESIAPQKEIKAWFCNPVPQQIKQGLYKIFQHNLPGIVPVSIKTDSCVTNHTPNRRPYVDLLTSQIGVALGGNGYAAKSCDEIGKVAVELVINGKWTYDLPQEAFKLRNIENRSPVSKL